MLSEGICSGTLHLPADGISGSEPCCQVEVILSKSDKCVLKILYFVNCKRLLSKTKK